MQFSEPAPVSAFLARWDPAGTTLAVAVGSTVTLWRGDASGKLRTFACGDEVTQIEWSPNGQMVLCGMYKTSQIKVFHRDADGPLAHIDETAAGCVRAMWSPASDAVLAFTDYELRISVWWFLDGTGTQGIVEAAGRRREKGVSFHGVHAAVAERRDAKDYLGIYDTRTWRLLRRFPLNTNELESVEWSSNGAHILVTDSSLDYRVCVYGLDGQCIQTYSAYDNELGVKVAKFSQRGMVAIGSFDDHVRLLDNIKFELCGEFSHPSVLSLPERIFKETEFMPDGTPSENASEFMRQRPLAMQIRFEKVNGAVSLPTVVADYEKPNPKAGVGMVEFSPKGRYLVSRNESQPTALWVWDLANLQQIALLVTREPIRSVKWTPVSAGGDKDPSEEDAQFAFCTGTSWVYLWQVSCISCYQVPISNFTVQTLQWQPTGQALLLCDKDRFCVGFF